MTRSKYQKLNKNDNIKLYQLRDEAARHMTRLTTATLPYHRFYQLKEEDPSAGIENASLIEKSESEEELAPEIVEQPEIAETKEVPHKIIRRMATPRREIAG